MKVDLSNLQKIAKIESKEKSKKWQQGLTTKEALVPKRPPVNKDRLSQIFDLRREFISDLKATIPTAMPDKIDPTSKSGQQYLRDLALHGVEEMFEALQHLKNWKTHRQTDVGEGFDRDEFLEEMVDAYNYFFALMINLGVTEDEFFEAFLKKHDIIIERLKTGY